MVTPTSVLVRRVQAEAPAAVTSEQYPLPRRRPLPPAGTGRSLGVWGWVTLLGVLGLASALRGIDTVLAGTAPSWYEPALAGLGLTGIVLAATAALAVRRRRLPWVLLGLATLPLGLNLALTLGVH
jgi:hypothetical protein